MDSAGSGLAAYGTTSTKVPALRLPAHRFIGLLTAATLMLSLPMPAAAARPQQPPSGPATIQFSGYSWTVKDYKRKLGPGPNLFSSSNVSVDADGQLHLRIEKSGKQWSCAEVIANASLGYGTYRWTVASPIDLDPNAVLGLFTWNDDAAYAHREIDVEFARWGNAADPTNAQYVVQPYDATGHQLRWTQSPAATSTTHSFTWSPGRVDFTSTDGNGNLLNWSYVGDDVPIPGGENPRINLWLFRGSTPTDGQPIEVVISDFSFTPPS
jgi:hypothetical protein